MSAGTLWLHVAAVSGLMIVGKMFPICVYRDEAPFATRLALSLGMCPRGEVGAGIIVLSLTVFGITGDAITIGVLCLALNLVASSLFIMAFKRLATTAHALPEDERPSDSHKHGQHRRPSSTRSDSSAPHVV